MSRLKYIANRYKLFLILCIFLIILSYFKKNLAFNILSISNDSLIQMIQVIPPIMILLGLLDEWISRESIMKYMGPDSNIIGVVLSITLAAFGAGPMYAAFPFTEVLLKKGVRLSNIIIFMNAWCVIKISTLLFEISALGYKFTLFRLLINLPGVIIMGYIVEYLVNKKSIN